MCSWNWCSTLRRDGPSRPALPIPPSVCMSLTWLTSKSRKRCDAMRGTANLTRQPQQSLLTTFARWIRSAIATNRLLDRAWKLRENLRAYDAVYVTLAEALDAVLLTCEVDLRGRPALRRAWNSLKR